MLTAEFFTAMRKFNLKIVCPAGMRTIIWYNIYNYYIGNKKKNIYILYICKLYFYVPQTAFQYVYFFTIIKMLKIKYIIGKTCLKCIFIVN